MTRDDKMPSWPFEFADQVAATTLVVVGHKMALSPNKVQIIGDAVRDAVLEALHDAPKQEIGQ
jgi:hypothetical protein